jgi:hypothetical protein
MNVDFNSERWFSDLKDLAEEFYNTSDKRFVTYDRKSIDRIKTTYFTRLRLLKKEIFGSVNPVGKRIDHHKIIALYVQLFMEKPIFGVPSVVNSAYASWPETMLINEMFCLEVLFTVLETWCDKKINYGKFKEYEEAFLKLLYYYREYSAYYKMNNYRRNSEHDKRNNLFTYALAHMVYFVEQNFMK